MEAKERCIVNMKAGTHYICQCGQSKNRPFSDGSHQGTGKEPYALEISEARDIALCGCLNSGNLPFCDGSHMQTAN